MPRRLLAVGVILLVARVGYTQSTTLSARESAAVFEEAADIAERDAGSLWGVRLYGPMLLVEPESRLVFANEPMGPHPEGDGVFSGVLPDTVGIANTSLEWAGRKWTMLMWPLPEDPFERRALIAHELWHRVQDKIGFPGGSAPNLHLGTRDGRVWLQLELRALSAALRSAGDSSRAHLRSGLTFRAMRLRTFPDAADEERVMLMHEGLAQYTGYALSGRSEEANRSAAALELEKLVGLPTFIRSFAYPMGAAYGLLLDRADPDWRSELTAHDDPARLVAGALQFSIPDSVDARAREVAKEYGGAVLMAEEDRLERERAERLAVYRMRFVEGPTLELPFVHMSVQFDPRTVDALDDLGKVYPSLRLSDEWGVLSVEGGALISSDWSKVVVPAPSGSSGRSYSGDGYTLELAAGWVLVDGGRVGSLTVSRSPTSEP